MRQSRQYRPSRPSLSALLAGLLLLPALLAAQAPPADGNTLLLHYPDVSRDKIAFTYGGDLWVVDVQGGIARRLTSHPGQELFPKFSPDGKWIAFTGQYSGSFQVYVISVDGGAPRQLTFHGDNANLPPRGGYDNEVLDWTPDGKSIVFRADRVPYDDRMGRPYVIPAAGGMERPLAIPESGAGSLSPDGTRFAYTPLASEFREWKHYRGGRNQGIWVYDLAHNTSERLTDSKAMDMEPAWLGKTIYFASDREHTRNLYALDPATRKTRQLTNHNDYDVLWPSAGPDRIVYEQGGAIWLFDPATETSHQVPIRVSGDLPETLPHFQNVRANVDVFSLSPTGKRALLEARGDIFTVPAQKGEIRNLTQTPGIREIAPTWSPDGRSVAYLSDRTGEYEIWLRRADGSGEERRVTTDGDVWRFPPAWSPDSKKLAFGDKKERLRFVDVESGHVVDADTSVYNDVVQYRWSPDSRHLAYVKGGNSQLTSIWIYSLEDGKARQLTDSASSAQEPVWDPQGRYLYFLSNRDFNLTFSGYEFQYVYTDPTRVYVGLLAKDGPALFLPQSDEEPVKEDTKGAKGGKTEPVQPPRLADPANAANAADTADAEKKAKADDKAAAGGEDKAAPKAVRVKIDFDGFERRVRALPGMPADYRDLNANADAVFYRVGRNPGSKLRMYSLKDEKESGVLDGIQGYDLSADGKKLIFQKGDEYGIADAAPNQSTSSGLLALDKLEVKIVPREEWRQEYVDAWRILRDWFYDPGMNGVDWKGIRDLYAKLLPSMATRADLDFLLGQIGGELSAGHVYVGRAPGTDPVPHVSGGLLGADVDADPSGYFRIAKIYPGENWHEAFRSPLTEPGVKVAAGDYVLAVDGQSTQGVDNFYRLLENKAKRVVTLLVNSSPKTAGAHEERVRPIEREFNLHYLDWVRGNREKVLRASGGRIGYIHLPDTAVAGNRELFKGFYPQAGKEALILDDRYNGGGFIPSEMIDLLHRPLLNYWASRGRVPYTEPNFVNAGPKVCLINGDAGSGGDAFPYYFRKLGMGPLVGTRTWGGLIGLNGNPPLLDGGTLSTPSFRFLTTEGTWDVEDVGVAPDVEVVDRPEDLAQGRDPGLEKAIEILLAQLKKNPPVKITAPPPSKLKD
ncbi:MAG TPA: PDZ domain-containing protein [Thermoanaerobaculia bacterium]|nr:PDZ domain-containing protein [Thermoanaerobaculia bacterium]